MNIVFCCVAIGNLGEVGVLSLRSLLAIPNAIVKAFVDSEGERWIRETVSDEGFLDERINFLRISAKDETLLQELDSSIEYRSFGNPKFFRLMYFKWIILENAISQHRDEPWVIFTDLDVYWAKSPEKSLKILQESNVEFLVQQDVKSQKGEVFLCPGIMVWKTTSQASEVLESVRKYHEHLLQENPVLPDDKALNLWTRNESNFSFFSTLNRHEYVIGHRLVSILLGLKGYKLKEMVAYHANYAVGISSKTQLLRYAQTKRAQLFLRLYRALHLLSIKLYVRFREKGISR